MFSGLVGSKTMNSVEHTGWSVRHAGSQNLLIDGLSFEIRMLFLLTMYLLLLISFAGSMTGRCDSSNAGML